MNAILVCVDYSDLLEITLPFNRHHFDKVCVVTTPEDSSSQAVARNNRCSVFRTNSFYDDGAQFNKWKALEEGLDWFGRTGWLCLMDADILWPKTMPRNTAYEVGCLYTPFRRMHVDLQQPIEFDARLWSKKYPQHPQEKEFAGYTQIFHGDDPALGEPPWHELNWRHCGGADSFFQRKWDKHRKIRPSWDVLHLGPNFQNWCGRASPYTDGTEHPESARRKEELTRMVQARRPGAPDVRFQAEKL